MPGKVPPHNREAEQSVLGGMLFDDRAIGQVMEFGLRGQHFYDEAHRRIFEVVHALFRDGAPIDLVTVSEALRRAGELESVGGAVYLGELLDVVPTIAHVEHYSRIVLEKATLREIIKSATDTLTDAYSEDPDIDGIIGRAQSRILTLQEEKQGSGFISLGDAINETVDYIQEIKQGNIQPGIMTRIDQLDEILSGLHRGELILIQGIPSAGKTALAQQICHDAADDPEQDVKVGMFVLEMPQRMMAARALGRRVRIGYAGLFDPSRLSFDDMTAIGEAAKELCHLPIYMDDATGPTARQVQAKAQYGKSKYGINLLLVDYLQLLSKEDIRMKDEPHIADCIAVLKNTARKLDVPLICISSVTKEQIQVESEGGRPSLYGSKGSSAIAYGADVVLHVSPDVTEDDMKKYSTYPVKIWVLKQKNGPCGKIQTRFHKYTMSFEGVYEGKTEKREKQKKEPEPAVAGQQDDIPF